MPRLELLASPPGTGKTERCIELFRSEILKSKSGIDSRSIFVLPSREHTERIQHLVLKKDLPGLFNVHLLTINELTQRLMSSVPSTSPTDAQRKAILRELLQRGEFPYFEPVRDLPGFHALLAEAVGEFKASLLTVAEFERRAQGLLKDVAFRMRYRDFSVVLKRYEEELRRRGLREWEDDIRRWKTQFQKTAPIGLVIFDGFYDFSSAQRALIGALAPQVRRLVVTLTLGTDPIKRPDLFYYPRKTVEALRALGFRPVRWRTQNHRVRESALLHLEKNLFLEHPGAWPSTPDAIQVLEAPLARDEVVAIAREIRRLYRSQKIHFSDICLILRQVAAYERIIESVFRELDIPVHVHERKKLIDYGLAPTLRRLFRLSLEGWKGMDVLFVLRSIYFSRLGGPEFRVSGVLTLLARRLEGRQAWQDYASSPEAATQDAEAIRALLNLERRIMSAPSAEALIEDLEGFIPDTDPDATQDQALKALKTLLRKIRSRHRLEAKENFSPEALLKEIDDTLETALFSVRPKGKNRVQVYDAIMALSKEYKIVFIPGLLEKSFPMEIIEDPFFKDCERAVMNRRGAILEERRLRLHGEKYFFYMAVCRAKERLYLSYPLVGVDDKALLPSFFLEEVQKCFPAIVPKKGSSGYFPPECEWEIEADVTRRLLRSFAEKKSLSYLEREALDEWETLDSFKTMIAVSERAQRARLSDPRAREIFSQPNTLSATRLETYQNCAFKYFASKVLRLEERAGERQALEMGQVLHKVLEEFYVENEEARTGAHDYWSKHSHILELLLKKLHQVTGDHFLAQEPAYRRQVCLESMADLLEDFVESEARLRAKRPLIPTYFEYAFNSLIVSAPEGPIRIEGKIDRIDQRPGQDQALLIDYKRSVRAESIQQKLEKGVELQLPIYVLALERLLNLQAIGAELRFLKGSQKKEREGIYRDAFRDLLGVRSSKQCYSKEGFDRLLSVTEEMIRSITSRLRSADISAEPRTCDHCPFYAICRFEKWRRGGAQAKT